MASETTETATTESEYAALPDGTVVIMKNIPGWAAFPHPLQKWQDGYWHAVGARHVDSNAQVAGVERIVLWTPEGADDGE